MLVKKNEKECSYPVVFCYFSLDTIACDFVVKSQIEMRTNDSFDLYTLWKRDEQPSMTSSTLLKPIPFQSNTSRFLVPTIGQVFYTDGYSSMKEDDYFERTVFDEEMEVPCIGTDQKNFEFAEMITFDILAESTRLPLMCKMIIYQQGATHEREPPLLVRDVCIQWDGIDHRNETNLPRTNSNDCLVNPSISNEINGGSSMTEDDDTSSIVTAGGTIQHRISPLLHRYKYLRQIDANILDRREFYSVPFYQYRGRRYGQRDMHVQIEESEFDHPLNETNQFEPTNYSVTMIFPVRDRRQLLDVSHIFPITIPMNSQSKHTTIGYVNTRQYVTIERTFAGQAMNV